MISTKNNVPSERNRRIGRIYLIVFIFSTLSFTLTAQFQNLSFKNISVAEGLSQNTVTCIEQDTLGFIWIGTFNGLNRYDGYDFKHYRSNVKDTNSLSIDRCINIISDLDGSLWVRTIDSTFHQYNFRSDNFTQYSLKDVPLSVRNSAKEQYEKRVLTHLNHQFIFQKEKSREFIYKNLETGITFNSSELQEDIYNIKDYYITELFIDRNHNLWIGTFSNGLYTAELRPKKFKHFFLRNAAEAGNNNIRAIFQDKDSTLWLGTRDNGLLKFDKDYHLIKHYKHDANSHFSINNNDIRKIYKDSKSRLWFALRGGISMYDSDHDRFKTIMDGSSDDISSYVFNIYEDSQGTIWFATLSGVGQFNELLQKVELLGKDQGVDIHPSVRLIIEDKNQNIWIGSEVGGLISLSIDSLSNGTHKKYRATKYMSDPNNSHSLSDNRIYSVAQDKNGYLWFGTGSGLNRFDPDKNGFDIIRRSHGLANDNIMGILADDSTHIWVSHKRGISRVDINSFSISNYTESEGIQAKEFNEDAYFKNPETGELFFGGPNGINYFQPDQMQEKLKAPDVYITSFYINGREVAIGDSIDNRIVLKNNIIQGANITLYPDDKSFSIGYAAINHSNTVNLKYQYKLVGFDKDWVTKEAEMRRAFYTNLNGGDYQFIVRASVDGKKWSKQEAILHLKVVPPLWENRWFQLVIVLLLLLWIWRRLVDWKRQKRILNSRVEERTKELEQSNNRIKEQLNKIKEQKEEITSQNEMLLSQNESIEAAYVELDLYRNKLELQVENRTKELLEAKNRAEESDRLKSSFIENLSHEVRTPLNAIVGFSSLAFENSFNEQEKEEYKVIVENNCNDLLKLIEDIVEYSYLETSEIKMCYQSILISQLMAEFKAIYQNQISKNLLYNSKPIKFVSSNQITEDDFLLNTDSERVAQIMQQLISNALKFTKEGSIEIGCYLTKDAARICFFVKDTGIGINPDKQSIIFNSFTKVEFSNKDLHRGVGIGLSIAAHLVYLLKGEIRLESEPLKGSTFSFEIPV